MSDQDAQLVQAVATKVARAELVKRALIVVITVLVTIVLVLGYRTLTIVQTAVKEIRATQEVGSPALRAIADQQDDIEAAANAAVSTNELLLGCFDPTSECAKESAAREAAQQGAYIAAVVAAQYCTDQVLPPTYTPDELTICVTHQIEGGDPR